MLFDRLVGVIKAVDDGVYFGTDVAVHFYDGDGPENFKRRIALPYGAVPGTGITYPKSGIIMGAMIRQKAGLAVGWLSERGYVKAHMSGRVEPGDKERVTVGMYAAGASFYREKDNIRQVVSMMQGETRSAMVSKDYAEAEVRRNGVLV